MRYVKIRATNYNEAIKELKKKHGDEAIPISHKYVKEGGIFKSKLFAKDVVELTAAVQERKRSSSSVDFTVKDDDKKSPMRQSHSHMSKEDAVSIDSINKTIDALNNNIRDIKTPQREPLSAAKDPLQQKAEDILKSAAAKEAKIEESAVPSYHNVDIKDSSEQIEKTIESSEVKNFEKEFNEIKETLKKLAK
jgi:flagellar biosynthesis GTPase FlhF